MTKTFTFNAKIWIYIGSVPWHFITVPKEISEEIDFFFKENKRGWGSLPVNVTLGKTSWKTSIFPDKKADSYILPIKAYVRKQEVIKEGDNINLFVEIKD